MRRAVVVLLLPLLVACGSAAPSPGGAEASVATSVAPSPTSPGSTQRMPSPSVVEPTDLAAADDGTWTPWTKGGPSPQDLSDAVSPAFEAADGVLRCFFDPLEPGHGTATVTCLRREGLGVDQPRPADCTGTWGDAVSASTEAGGGLVCVEPSFAEALDAQAPTQTLADGAAVTYDGLTCAVRSAAVQCLSSDARGFVLSPRAIVTR